MCVYLPGSTAENAQRCIRFYLIDVRLSDGNGFDLCRDIRETDRTPIIFLTGADGEREQIRGYELGGDAYINKPFTVEGLIEVIHALIRRQQWQSGKGSERVKSGVLTIDLANHQVWQPGGDDRAHQDTV